jgi:hypothetical protein
MLPQFQPLFTSPLVVRQKPEEKKLLPFPDTIIVVR